MPNDTQDSLLRNKANSTAATTTTTTTSENDDDGDGDGDGDDNETSFGATRQEAGLAGWGAKRTQCDGGETRNEPNGTAA